jgi:hypothetical protein
MNYLKKNNPWPKKTISVTNQNAPLTRRQSVFAKKLVGTVNRTVNVKNKY